MGPRITITLVRCLLAHRPDQHAPMPHPGATRRQPKLKQVMAYELEHSICVQRPCFSQIVTSVSSRIELPEQSDPPPGMLHCTNAECSLWKEAGSQGEAAGQSQEGRSGRNRVGTWPEAVTEPARRVPGGREDLRGSLRRAAGRTRPAAPYAVLRVMRRRSSASSARVASATLGLVAG